jgi:hypothetical protein
MADMRTRILLERELAKLERRIDSRFDQISERLAVLEAKDETRKAQITQLFGFHNDNPAESNGKRRGLSVGQKAAAGGTGLAVGGGLLYAFGEFLRGFFSSGVS